MADFAYSRTQVRLLHVLGDGHPHTQRELRAACGDVSWSVVKVHLCYLRKKLRDDPRIESANAAGVRIDVLPFPDKDEAMYQLVRISPISLNPVKTA